VEHDADLPREVGGNEGVCDAATVDAGADADNRAIDVPPPRGSTADDRGLVERRGCVRGFVTGVIAAFVGMAAAGYVYFAKGLVPVATSAPPMPLERRLARLALHARLEKEMPRVVPIEASEAGYTAGARDYVEHCAVCHGLPGKPPTAIARGEFPKPPRLFEGKGVTDDPPGETYWKIAHGIRLTGMPGFEESLSQTQMWQLSLLLANADKLPSSVTAILAGRPSETPPPASPPAAAGPHPPE
jgi:mono/diheme cytochrome c family protein